MNDIQKAMAVFIKDQALQFAHEDALIMNAEFNVSRAKISYKIKKFLGLV